MTYIDFVHHAILFLTGVPPDGDLCSKLCGNNIHEKVNAWENFTKVAAINGITTLVQVEALADLLHATYTQGALDLPLAKGMQQAEEHFTKTDPRNTAEDKGSKYHKEISGTTDVVINVDTYDQLVANTIICPATAHAIKKINDAGARGTKSWEQDIDEAINSLVRAKQLRPAMLKAIQRLIDKGIPND